MAGPIVIFTLGSRDDVQLCAVLGRPLRLRGHRVRVLASHHHARFVTDELEHFPLSLDHEWVFARIAAVVHRGGSGNTATALRAGRAQRDLPLRQRSSILGRAGGRRLGAGPKPLLPRHLRAEVLGEAVRTAVTDPAMRDAAAEGGRKLRAENGVERACEVIEDWLRDPEPSGFGNRVLTGRSW